MMNTSEKSPRTEADIVAFDREGNAVLLVEVKARRKSPADAVAQLIDQVEAASVEHGFPFGMLVDLDEIRVYRFDGASPREPVLSLDTTGILRWYDPDFGSERVFGRYLETLVEAWIRDLAYRWKTATPPGADLLEKIDLLTRLQGGSTSREVVLGGNPLR